MKQIQEQEGETMKRLTMIVLLLAATALAASGAVVSTIPCPDDVWGLAHDGTDLWAGQDEDVDGTPHLIQVDPADGATGLVWDIMGEDLRGVAWDGSALWVYSWRFGSTDVDQIYQVDPADGSVLTTLDTPFASNNYVGGMTWHGGALWVSRYYPDDPTLLYELDPATGEILSSIPSPHGQPQGMASDGTDLYVVGDDFSGETAMLYRIDPATGDVLESTEALGPDQGDTVNPRGLALDSATGHLWLVANWDGAASGQGIYEISLGEGQPAIELSAEELDFGVITVDGVAVEDILASNIGSADLTLAVSASGHFSATVADDTVPPGGSTSIDITFSPSEWGQANGELTVTSNDPLQPTLTLPLTGFAVYDDPTPNIVPGELDFGPVWVPRTELDGVAVDTLLLQNLGIAPLILEALTLEGDPSFELLEQPTLPLELQALETQAFAVQFAPQEEGPFIADVRFDFQQPVEEITLPLTGEGVLLPEEMGTYFWSHHFAPGVLDAQVSAMMGVPDMDGDGVGDLVVSHEEGHTVLISGASSGEAVIRWDFATDTNTNFGYALSERGLCAPGDLDGDDVPDVVLATGGGNEHVYAISGATGAEIWSYGNDQEWDRGDFNAVSVHDDLDEDGVAEILAAQGNNSTGTAGHTFYCFNGATGAVEWSVAVPGGSPYDIIPVTHHTWDGAREVACALGGNGTTGIQIRDGRTGDLIVSVNVDAVWDLEAAEADLDGDGYLDFVAAEFWDGIVARSGLDGSAIWMNTSGTLFTEVLRLGDTNGDEMPEFVGTTLGSMVTGINGANGGALWQSPIGDNQLSTAVVPDLNGDLRNDVLVGALDNMIYVLNGQDGDQLFSMGSPGGAVDAVAALDDLDNNASTELVVGTREGWVACFSGGDEAQATYPAVGEITDGQLDINLPDMLVEEVPAEVMNDGNAPLTLSLTDFAFQNGPTDMPSNLYDIQWSGGQPGQPVVVSLNLADQAVQYFEGYSSGAAVLSYATNDPLSPEIEVRFDYLVLEADAPGQPYRWSLGAPYPNPFNNVVRLHYTLPRASEVRFQVVDILGREVARIQRTHRGPGAHDLLWPGVDASGQPVASGSYLIRMQGEGFSAEKRVLLLK